LVVPSSVGVGVLGESEMVRRGFDIQWFEIKTRRLLLGLSQWSNVS
jgi:hypothetical protein